MNDFGTMHLQDHEMTPFTFIANVLASNIVVAFSTLAMSFFNKREYLKHLRAFRCF
jgi:hypothetical protein